MSRKNGKAGLPKKKVPKLVINQIEEPESGHKISAEPRKIISKPSANISESEEEPITRLERPVKAHKKIGKQVETKFEKIENDLSPKDSHQHDSTKSMAMSWWVLISGSLLVMILIAVVVLSNYKEGLAMTEVEASDIPLASSDPFEGSPEKWFRQRAGGIGDQATKLMMGYLGAKDRQTKSQYVRNPEKYLELSSSWPVKVNPRMDSISENQWSINHTEGTAFLSLNTENQEFLPTRVYFVRQDDELKIDWMASVAWSDWSIGDLKKAMMTREKQVEETRQKTAKDARATGQHQKNEIEIPPPVITEPILLRCLLFRRNEFYAGPYNDKDHAAFMLISPDKDAYLWGYVERDSKLDLKLRKLLDHGSFVVDLKKDVRVTLRVRAGKKDALPSQLELMELVHPEWVQP